MKKLIIVLVVIGLAGGIYYFISKGPSVTEAPKGEQANTVASTTNIENRENPGQTIIGKSVEGRDIVAYHYGTGDSELVFVGGIHGGYEWNTVLVAYELIDYINGNPAIIPADIKVTVIPVLNPDGLNKVVGTAGRFAKSDVPTSTSETVPGRFNANNVDLNRNFDCDWQTEAT